MIVTLGELRGTVSKALFGTGAPAGLDVEAGASALWLEARGMPAISHVLEALDAWREAPLGNLAFVEDARGLVLDAGGRSALYLGPMILDQLAVGALKSQAPFALTVTNLQHAPLLLRGLERLGLAGREASLTALSGELFARAGPAGLALGGSWADAVGACECRMTAPASPGTADVPPDVLDSRVRASLASGLNVPDSLWSRLQDYARLSTVPDSELSRLKGAGNTSSVRA